MKRRQVAILIAIVYVAIGLILVYNCYYFFALDSVVQSQSQEQLSREFKNNGHNSTIQISVKRRINVKLRQSYYRTKRIHIKLLSNNQGSGDTVYYLAKVNGIKVQLESKVI
ncbi:hypothetical protein Lbuc_2094 [Lentilactobacillus buchneri NRRL B-30929]|nr:hypothetical protein Lbuc_2094 [Lentilactobacillus buchneri NRRL B-30929]